MKVAIFPCTMERPNLKICIENDGDSESDEDKPVIEGLETVKEDDLSDAGVVLDEELKETPPEAVLEVRLDPTSLQQPKQYKNKAGEFVTGFDPLSKEYKELRKKRAERFGIKENENIVSEQDLKALYSSLGINEEAINSGERGIRLNAIHVRGVDNMSTDDVFKYFQDFTPGSLEWIDDTSCNVVWVDHVTAARAIIHLSRPVDDYEISEQKGQNLSTHSDNSEKSAVRSTEESMEVNDTENENATDKKDSSKKDEEFDYELNLLTESENSDEEMSDVDKTHNKDIKKTEAHSAKQVDNSRKEEDKDVDRKKHRLQSDTKEYPVPPGKWRIGVPYLNRTQVLYMRYATKADKKQPGAGKRSLYYRKYGNPNFGGMKGLISKSRKTKILASKYRQEELEAKKIVMKCKKFTNIPEETAFDKHVQEAVKSNLQSRLKFKDPPIRDYLEKKRKSIETENAEDELQILISDTTPPCKKRKMRMYADDIEVETKKIRSSTPQSPDSAVHNRLLDSSDLVGDARSRITGRRLSHTAQSQTPVCDLRNILGRKRQRDQYSSSGQPLLTVQVELD